MRSPRTFLFTFLEDFFFDHGALWLTLVRDVKEKLDCGKFRQEADPHALRRKHFYCQRRTFPLHECCFQPISLALKLAESTTLLSTLESVTLTSA